MEKITIFIENDNRGDVRQVKVSDRCEEAERSNRCCYIGRVVKCIAEYRLMPERTEENKMQISSRFTVALHIFTCADALRKV